MAGVGPPLRTPAVPTETRGALIEIEFEPAGDVTTVHFKHSQLWDESSAANHKDGWNKCFDNLDRALAAEQSTRAS